MKPRVLVTGSSGFLGKYVVDFLKEKDYKVVAFDIVSGQDLLNKNHLEKCLAKVDYVCHLAAIGDVYLAAKDPALASTVSCGGTANLYYFANKFPIKKIIYASTWEVYGKPLYQPIDEKHPCFPDHPYSITKYAGELMLQSKLNLTPWIILRLGTAYGHGMRKNAVMPLFINKAKKGETIILQGGGKQTRQFTHAKDIARAFYLALKSEIKNEIFNIISEETQTIKEIAQMVDKFIPVKIKTGPARPGDVQCARISAKKVQKKLNWQAKITFRKGFEDLISSLR